MANRYAMEGEHEDRSQTEITAFLVLDGLGLTLRFLAIIYFFV